MDSSSSFSRPMIDKFPWKKIESVAALAICVRVEFQISNFTPSIENMWFVHK